MIDVLEACELVTKGTDTPFISGITDIGDKFIIATLTKDGLPIDSATYTYFQNVHLFCIF